MATVLAITLAAAPAQATSKVNFQGEFVKSESKVYAMPGSVVQAPLVWKSHVNYSGNQDIAFVLTAPTGTKFAEATMRVSRSTDNGATWTSSLPTTRCKYKAENILLCDGIPVPPEQWTWSNGVMLKFEVPIFVPESFKQVEGKEVPLTGGSVMGKFKSSSPTKSVVYLDGTGSWGVTLPPKPPVDVVDPAIAGVALGGIALLGAGAFFVVRRRRSAQAA